VTRYVVDASVAVRLATDGAAVAEQHSLLAPTLLRSDALALVYGQVRAGRIAEPAARTILDGIRALRIRLLGDRVLQSTAWEIADALGWADTYRAEYLALTRLQADALVTVDADLAAAAGRCGLATADLAELTGRRDRPASPRQAASPESGR
jgi:predicted nucleic acid-binding protein